MLIKPRQLIKLNIKYHLDQNFIQEGHYENIELGDTAYDNTDLSALKPVQDNNDLAEVGMYNTTGRVWQSPFQNWVYESGVSHQATRGEPQKDAPILCSGVYVNGVFKPISQHMPWGPSEGWDPTLIPEIDWMFGRVVFNSGVPLDATIRAEYSYKNILVDFANKNTTNVDEYVANSKYGTNPYMNQSIVYPSGRFRPLPAVMISIGPSRFGNPLELGNLSSENIDELSCFVYSPDVCLLDEILDIIRFQNDRVFNIVDYNIAPLPMSGFIGERSPEYRPYNTLENHVVTHPSGYRSLYAQGQFQDMTADEDFSADHIELGLVEGNILTWIIVPDGDIPVAPIDTRFFDVGKTD